MITPGRKGPRQRQGPELSRWRLNATTHSAAL